MLYSGKETIHSETVDYLLTQVVQSDSYYKSLAVGVMSKVGLLLAEIFRVLLSFSLFRLKRHGVSYTYAIQDVKWYKHNTTITICKLYVLSVSCPTRVNGNPKAPFSIVTTLRRRALFLCLNCSIYS